MSKKTFPIILLFVLGALLRLLWLHSHDLWYDETNALYRPLSIQENAPLFFYFLNSIVQPVYYLGIKGRLIEFVCRLPSALFGIFSLVPMYLLASKIAGRRAALFSLFILAASPFHLWYSQEARPYSLAVLCSLLSNYYFVQWVNSREPANGKRNACVLFSILGVFTFYLNAIFLVFQFIYYLIVKKELKGALPLLFPLLLLVFWFPLFNQMPMVLSSFWPAVPRPDYLLVTLENSIWGYNGSTAIYWTGNILIAGLAPFLLRGLFKLPAGSKAPLLLSACLYFLPIAGVYFFSRLFVSIYIDRIFIIFTPYLYILVGFALDQISAKFTRICAVCLLAVLLLAADVRYFSDNIYQPCDTKHHIGVYIKKPYRPLVSYLLENRKENEPLVIANPGPMFSIGFYTVLHKNLYEYTLDINRKKQPPPFIPLFFYACDPFINDTIWNVPNEQIYLNNPKINAATKGAITYISKDFLPRILPQGGRLFFIGCDWARSGNLDENSLSVKTALDSSFVCLETTDFDGLILYVYAARD